MKQLSPPPSATNLSTSAELLLTKQPLAWLRAFWKFSRPHTVIGTTLSVLALCVITFASTQTVGRSQVLLPVFHLSDVLLTLLACLCGNVYIVGLNQVEDVAIDRINKPHLPIAAGEFSRRQAIAIVVTTGSLALALAAWQGPYLLAMVLLSLSIGTAYSLPPIRLKRLPLLASLCIFTVRGLVVNLGLFLHFNHKLTLPAGENQWAGFPSNGSLMGSDWFRLIPAPVWALTLFILVFTFAIAIFKDIPDAEGDRQYNITTYTLRLGQKTVFNLSRWVLTIAYLGLIVGGLWGLPEVNSLLLVSTHLAILSFFWVRSLTVDLADKAAISHFYQFIWKLFFLEYLIFPMTCL